MQSTSIVANIKDLGGDVEEKREVAYDAVGNMSFPGGWKTTHDNNELS